MKVGRSKRVRGLGGDRRHVASIVTRSDWIAIGCGDNGEKGGEERNKERKKGREGWEGRDYCTVNLVKDGILSYIQNRSTHTYSTLCVYQYGT